MIIVLVMICSFSSIYSEPPVITKHLKTKGYQFQQALAQLYVQKPHLLQHHNENEIHNQTDYSAIKKIIDYSPIGISLAYFCYGSANTYFEYKNNYHQFQENYINQVLTKIFPGLFINSPRIIGLFLQETELLLQAYLLKLMLKMILFCFG